MKRGKEEEEGRVERRRVVCFWRPDMKVGSLPVTPHLMAVFVCMSVYVGVVCAYVWSEANT